MKNEVLFNQPESQGIYQRGGKVNGQTSWFSLENTNVPYALWYSEKDADWMFGPLSFLGGSLGAISSTADQGILSCPYTVPKDAWSYALNNAWLTADTNDVIIECLAGNHKFYELISNAKMLDVETNN